MSATSIAKAKDFAIRFIEDNTKSNPAVAEQKIFEYFKSDFPIKDIDVERILLELETSKHIYKENLGFYAYKLTKDGRLFLKSTSFQNELNIGVGKSINQFLEKSHERRFKIESIAEAKRSNDIAEKSLTQSRRANIISIIAIIISLFAIVISLMDIDLSK